MRIHVLATLTLAAVSAGAAPAKIVVTAPRLAVPLTNPGGWFNAWDFPQEAVPGHHEGTVGVRLSVAQSGRVAGCTIVNSAGFPELDQVMCKVLIERARFVPGPEPSYYVVSRRWIVPLGATPENRPMVMARSAVSMRAPAAQSNPLRWIDISDYPGDAAKRGGEAGVAYRLDIDTLGKVSGCTAKSDRQGAEDLEKATCALLRERAKFWPALDHYGSAIAGVYKGRVNWGGLGMNPGPPAPADLLITADSLPQGWGSPIILSADILVGEDGIARDCFFRSTVAAPRDGSNRPTVSLIPLGESGCKRAVGTWKARPVMDSNGKPAPSIQTMTFQFVLNRGQGELARADRQ